MVYTAPAPLGPWTAQAAPGGIGQRSASDKPGPHRVLTLPDAQAHSVSIAMTPEPPNEVACIALPPTCAQDVPEQAFANLSCPAGTNISTIVFASYGTPTGSCVTGFELGACNALSSPDVVAGLCIGRPSCSFIVNSSTFLGDPCVGTSKVFSAIVECSATDSHRPRVSRDRSLLETLSLVDALGLHTQPTPGNGCNHVDPLSSSVTLSRANCVIEISSQGLHGELLETILWIGDRWQQAPDGLKGHDPQFGAPLVFDAAGRVLEMSWLDNFTMPTYA